MTDEQYTQAESFWTRKDETEKKLDADALYSWIDEFLSSHKVLALATATKDFIRCTPLSTIGIMEHFGSSPKAGLSSKP